MTDPRLIVEQVSKRYGPTQALADVSVSFLPGEVHALMGENGAGKSTLGKVIAGLVKPDSGTVTIDGRALRPGSIHDAFGAGVRIVHQELAQCPNMSVAENLCLHDLPRNRLGFVDRRAMNDRARALLERLEPVIDVRVPLATLSPGHRQIIQIAGSLDEKGLGSDTQPDRRAGLPTHAPHAPTAKVLVLDEPTSSLSVAETDRLLAIVRRLAADGLTIIYVSHRMGEIFACCDRVTVLRDGRFIATSPVKDIDEPALVEQMIGRRLEAVMRRETAPHAVGAPAAAPLLEARGISSPGKLRSISLEVRPGETVGVGGLVGAGRSELLDAIFGLDARARGDVRIAGRPAPPRNPRALIRAGVGYVPEDRKLQGLFFQLGIDENILVPAMPALARAGLRSFRRERALVAERISSLAVKTASTKSLPGQLSGGNQQKLLIARWLSGAVKVLLLDEPTRGIDVGTKAEIYRHIRAAADRGAAILLVSSEMPELLALSDRILVLSGGRLAGELRGEEMTQANILRLATSAG